MREKVDQRWKPAGEWGRTIPTLFILYRFMDYEIPGVACQDEVV
jgi:hypothetical protein